MPVIEPECFGAISIGLAAEPKVWKLLANIAMSKKKIAAQKLDVKPLQNMKEKEEYWITFTWQTAACIHDTEDTARILRGQVLGIYDASHIVETVPKKTQSQ